MSNALRIHRNYPELPAIAPTDTYIEDILEEKRIDRLLREGKKAIVKRRRTCPQPLNPDERLGLFRREYKQMESKNLEEKEYLEYQEMLDMAYKLLAEASKSKFCH